MRTLLEEAISEYFGERCPDFEPGCPCCRAWAEFDETERLRTALLRADRYLALGSPGLAANILHLAIRGESNGEERSDA